MKHQKAAFRRYAVSEAVGAVVICCAAAALHFVYPLSGGSTLAVIFGAVNESTWEHVKIFSAAYGGYALLQLLWVRMPLKRYVVGKCCGLYLLMGGVIGYSWLIAHFSDPLLWLDISASAVLVALAQFCSYRLTVRGRNTADFFIPALLLILLYYLMFFSFTVFPPQAWLFRDPVTGGYGIPGTQTLPSSALKI